MTSSLNIRRLEIILEALGPIADSMVFTGGAVVELYAQRPEIFAARPTKDIDTIVSAATRSQYLHIEEQLLKRGFIHAGLAGIKGPTCRYVFQEIIFDVMPQEERILGFSNRWFRHALENPFPAILPSGNTVRLATFPRFLAIKFETFADRAKGDIRGSHDLEDIVRLISHRQDPLKEVEAEVPEIKGFLKEASKSYLALEVALEALKGAAPLGTPQAKEVYQVLESLAAG